MKKVISFILCCVLVVSVCSAMAVDLSGMSLDELVALKDQINLAIWNSNEWQEVTVPQGVWVVGEDIPAGKWTVKCAHGNGIMMKECDIEWGEYLNDNGKHIKWKGRWDTVDIFDPENKDYKEGYLTEYTLDVQDGDYIIIDDAYNKAIFTPYAGKPSLGFK